MTATQSKAVVKPVIHAISSKGLPLCGFTKRDKRSWPPKNYWVLDTDTSRRERVTCADCKKDLRKKK